ncbi:MAG: oxygenase MpaB family protein [Actinomycetota bacterium]|nr:oxygenase MpaB family protein [Actinomycetota bacterium]
MDRRTRPSPPREGHLEVSRLQRGAMLAPAAANVVMQLARRGVGRGVAKSSVTSGSLMRHPLKRTRTTLAYIWVALYGTDDERSELRRNVDAQHRHVRSHPGDDVAYDAFDAQLQLWVAACMYVGTLQGYEMLYGPPSDDVATELLAQCSRFATTLQVPASQWPLDRADFSRYWATSLALVEFDEVTTRYVRDFIELRFIPRPLAAALGPLHRLLCVGFLEATFREALSLRWSERDQHHFERWCTVLRRMNQVLPPALAQFPWNLVRFDTRRRLARGRTVV